MSVVFSHETALTLYRAGMVDPHSRKRSLQTCCSSLHALDEPFMRNALKIDDAPLHCLVDSPKKRRRRQGFICHADSFGQSVVESIIAGVFVSTPECLFFQLARSLPTIDAVRLGFELCGTYSLHHDNDGFFKRPPLTTTAKIDAYLKRRRDARFPRDVKHTSSILRLVVDGSASPRETALAILLTAPLSQGGYGLPRPKLNHCIAVPDRIRHRLAKSRYLCDAFWPEAGIALEYDSDAFHADGQKIAQDSDRRSALLILGIKVITVTNRQISFAASMDRAAWALGKELGHRIRWDKCRDYKVRQQLLRMSVLSPRPYSTSSRKR